MEENTQNQTDGNNSLSVNEPEKQINNSSEKPWLWKPGQSGNPNGRPQNSYSIVAAIKQKFDADPSLRHQIADKLCQMALAGNLGAMKVLAPYLDGLPVARMDEPDETPQTQKVHMFTGDKADAIRRIAQSILDSNTPAGGDGGAVTRDTQNQEQPDSSQVQQNEASGISQPTA